MATVQIQVRLGSTRLPGKALFPLGNKRVIEWVVERAHDTKKSKNTYLAIGDRTENDAIREWCDRAEVNYCTESEKNLLKRHLKTAEVANSDPVVRITGDCPFASPSEIDRVIKQHEKNGAHYTTNVTDTMPIGTAVDVIDKSVLEQLADMGDKHPVRRLRKQPDEWNIVVTANDQWTAFNDTHLAVDTPEDYWALSDALEAVGNEPLAVAKWLSEK